MAGELIFQNVRCFACLSYTSLFLYATKQEGNLSSVTVVSPLSPTGPTVVDSSQPLVITYWRKKKRGFRDSDCLSLEEEHKFQAMFWRELDLRDMNIDKSAYDPVFNNELILFDSNDLYCIRLIEDKQLWMTYLQKVIAYNHNLHSICVPDEILIHILSYMNTRELLLRISILSSHMNILCRSNIIWQNLFAKKWPMCKRTASIDYYRNLLNDQDLQWYQMFCYRYIMEKEIMTKKRREIECNEDRSTEDCTNTDYTDESGAGSANDDSAVLADLRNIELFNDDAIKFCDMANDIKLPELTREEREKMGGKDLRELPPEMQYEKQLLILLACNIFEEHFDLDMTKVYILRNYTIMMQRLTLPKRELESPAGIEFTCNKLRYIVEKMERVISLNPAPITSSSVIEEEPILLRWKKWRNEVVEVYTNTMIGIVMDLPDNKKKMEYLTFVEGIVEKYTADKTDLSYKIFKASLLGKQAKFSTPKEVQFNLYDQAIKLLEDARQIASNSSTICNLGNMIFDRLVTMLQPYREAMQNQSLKEEEKSQLEQQLKFYFYRTMEVYEHLETIPKCEGLSYYNRACLHSIFHGTNFLGFDHDAETKNYLEQTLTTKYILSSMDDDPDFDLVRHYPWFLDIRARYTEKVKSKEVSKQTTTIPSVFARMSKSSHLGTYTEMLHQQVNTRSILPVGYATYEFMVV
jgi:hypothetical protein